MSLLPHCTGKARSKGHSRLKDKGSRLPPLDVRNSMHLKGEKGLMETINEGLSNSSTYPFF